MEECKKNDKTSRRGRKKASFYFDQLIRYMFGIVQWFKMSTNLEQEVYRNVSARTLISFTVYLKIYVADNIAVFTNTQTQKSPNVGTEGTPSIAPVWELSGLIFTVISDKIVQYKYTVYLCFFFSAKQHSLLDKLWCSFVLCKHLIECNFFFFFLLICLLSDGL